MTPKLFLLIFAGIGVAPAVAWSLASIVTTVISNAYRPVSLSFRFYASAGSSIRWFQYHELPLLTCLCILAGAALLIVGIISIPHVH